MYLQRASLRVSFVMSRKEPLFSMKYDAAFRPKCSAGLSKMDVELYRRILCSKNFGSDGEILREEISTITRHLMKLQTTVLLSNILKAAFQLRVFLTHE